MVPKGIVARILKNKLKVIYPLLLTATTAHMASFSEQHIAVLNWHLANDYRDNDDDDDDDSSSSSSSSSDTDSDDSDVVYVTPIIIDNSHYTIHRMGGDGIEDLREVYQSVLPYTFVGHYALDHPELGVLNRDQGTHVAFGEEVGDGDNIPYIYEDVSSVMDLLLY